MKRGVSVIVCCYNSEKRLPKTLEALAKQETKVDWEVIVVDNNSTDNTSQVAINLWETLGKPTYLRVVKESNPGLSNARMRGAKESSFEYLIFCDDDNWLFKNYITETYNSLNSKSSIAIIGGEGIPMANISFPYWFEEFKKSYAVGDQTQNAHSNVLYGAGIALRKDVFTKVFHEFPSLVSDRSGKKLIGGGDDEICLRFYLAGFKPHFVKELKFYHFIPESRLTLNYIKRIHFWSGYSRMFLLPYHYVITHKGEKKSRFIWIKDLLFLFNKLLKARNKFHVYNCLGSITMLLTHYKEYTKMIKIVREKYTYFREQK